MLTTALAERAVGKSLVLNFGKYIQSQVVLQHEKAHHQKNQQFRFLDPFTQMMHF